MGRGTGDEQAQWAAAVAQLDEAKSDLLAILEAAEKGLSERTDSPAGKRKEKGNDPG